MVGGEINDIEFLYQQDERLVYSVAVVGTGCEKATIVDIKISVKSEHRPLLRKDTPIWWQQDRCFLGPNDIEVIRIWKASQLKAVEAA